MAVASEHLGMTVACPHCNGEVQTPRGALGAPPPPDGWTQEQPVEPVMWRPVHNRR